MRKAYLNYLGFLIFISTNLLPAQQFTIRGEVRDADTDLGLSFANIRINKSNKGTSANKDGQFELKLKPGNYSIIASFIGYFSDTLNVNLSENLKYNFNLKPTQVEIDEIIVEPGINPALAILKKTIDSKIQIKDRINNYKYSSYTKGLIKTTRDYSGGNFSLSTQDTAKLKITGILENESRGFYKKPDKNKHFIVARKQTANTPPFINILTGGLLIQSFYDDQLTFLGQEVPSPISEEALDYYYYYVEKEFVLDRKKVFQIYFNTDNPSDPGFYGRLFIEDSTFYLLKAEVNLNRMANPGGLFEYVKIFQQFSIFNDGIPLPIDYRLFANGNYLGLAKFGFELHTLMNDYSINTELDDDLFDNAIVSVIPGADKKEENYWNSIQTIPNTKEEEKAYSRIDSLSKISKTLGQDFSFLDSELKLNDNFSTNGLINMYSFNKIEGHTLNLNLNFKDGDEQRLNIYSGISYGFADEIFKKEISTSYMLGEYRTSRVSINLYDNLSDLFAVSDNYNQFTSTFLSLISKYDFRDYFYSKGFDVNISGDILPQVNLGIGYFNRTDETAKNNTNFSFFYKDRTYPENEQIINSTLRGLNATINLDFRKFIEDGFFRRRIGQRNNVQFVGSVLLSNTDLIKSDFDFTIYELKTFGSFITIGNWSLDFYGSKVFSSGNVPFQWLYALPGNINTAGKNNSFRTLRIGEVYGDDVTTLFLKHNFNDDLFKISGIPFIKDLQLQFSTHLNIALSNISQNSRKILNRSFKKITKPFYELGFSLGHLLIPITLEFTWKLNYHDRNNFVFGINTFAF